MTQFPSGSPRTRKELFERVRAVISHGPYVMPEESHTAAQARSACSWKFCWGQQQAGTTYPMP